MIIDGATLTTDGWLLGPGATIQLADGTKFTGTADATGMVEPSTAAIAPATATRGAVAAIAAKHIPQWDYAANGWICQCGAGDRGKDADGRSLRAYSAADFGQHIADLIFASVAASTPGDPRS